MKFLKIGMRTTKTVLAVIITLIIAELFNLKSPILAGVAAIMTMESSVSESVLVGKNRVYGTILGALIGLMTSYLLFETYILNYIFVAIGLVLLISICNYFGWDKATKMAMVVFLVIILGTDKNKFNYALNRTIDTMVGVIIGTGINFSIRPPNMEQYLNNLILQIRDEIINAVANISKMKEYEDDDIKLGITNLEEKYNVFVEDMKYYIRKKDTKEKYLKLFASFDRAKNHIVIINEMLHDDLLKDEKMEDAYNYHLDTATEEVYSYHLETLKEELNIINEYIDELL